MPRKACKTLNANAQNGWVDNMRPIGLGASTAVVGGCDLVSDNEVFKSTWAAVKSRFDGGAGIKRSAQRKPYVPPGKLASNKGSTLVKPVALDFSTSDYWESMKRVALAKFEQENIVLARAGRWNTPHADIMSELDYGQVATIQYAMALHRLGSRCDHQLELLRGLCGDYFELLSGVIKPAVVDERVSVVVYNECAAHLNSNLPPNEYYVRLAVVTMAERSGGQMDVQEKENLASHLFPEYVTRNSASARRESQMMHKKILRLTSSDEAGDWNYLLLLCRAAPKYQIMPTVNQDDWRQLGIDEQAYARHTYSPHYIVTFQLELLYLS